MNRLHGVFSLLLVVVSVLIGIYAIINDSVIFGFFYIAAVVLSIPVVLYSYCSKCNCRLDSCVHVIPGKLTKFLPDRQDKGYNIFDYMGVSLPLGIIILFPQLGLWKNKVLFFSFWVLLIIALFEIFLFVCKGCANDKCPLCPVK